MAKSDEDDLGLPENPTYSNYSNRMWKAHTNTRHGLVQSPERSRESAHGGRLPQDEPPAAKDNPPLVVEEGCVPLDLRGNGVKPYHYSNLQRF